MELKIDKQVKGVRIISEKQAKDRRTILNLLISIAEAEGFEEVILPSLEPSSIYVGKAGEEILKQMYAFEDKKKSLFMPPP